MANSGKVLQVRLQEKIDTLANWLALDTDTKPFIPLAGEKINVKVPTANSEADGETIGYEIISKTGDGVLGANGVVTGTRFKDLPWDSALAADVYDWAKKPAKPEYSYNELKDLPTIPTIPTHRTLTIKDADSDTTTKAITYNPVGNSNQTLTIAGSNGVTVNAETNKITVSGTTANGTKLGQVKEGANGGGDVTIIDGVITVKDDSHNHIISNIDGLTDTLAGLENNKVPTSRKINGHALTGDITLVPGDLGLGQALNFKGTKASKSNLPTSGNVIGDVWLVTDTSYEYVWTTANKWEELGDPSSLSTEIGTVAANLATEIADRTTEAGIIKGYTITAGKGLTGTGAISSSPTLNVGAGTGIVVNNDDVALATVSGLTTGIYGPSNAVNGTHGTKVNIPQIQVDAYGRVISISNKEYTSSDTTYSAATQGAAGLMSAADKTKLDGIAANANNYTYTLPEASSSTMGGIKVSSKNSSAVTVNSESTTAGRYYPIELNNDGKAIVNVPWSNTTYNLFTTAANGLTSKGSDANNVLFGDNTWHGAISRAVSGHENDTTEDYIILCAGSATANIL